MVIHVNRAVLYNHRLVTGLGVGVHRTWFISFSFPFPPEPSQPAILPIASALRAAAVPSVDRSKSLFAAGVKLPSVLLGVHVGGPIEDPFLDPEDAGVREIPGVLPPCNNPAFARRLFDAFADSLWDIDSRDEGPGI